MFKASLIAPVVKMETICSKCHQIVCPTRIKGFCSDCIKKEVLTRMRG